MFRNVAKTAVSTALALTLAAGAIVYALVEHQAPSFTDVGHDYTGHLFAEYSGLGNQDLNGRINFSGTVQYTCQNNGGNTAPGQPKPFSGHADQSVRAETKNGRATIDLTASFLDFVPATLGGRQAGCANNQWTGVDPVVVGTVSANGTIRHGNSSVFASATISLAP
jgi:hypothetical protein